VGSLETMEFVARHRYAYMGIPYFHIDFFKKTYRLFKRACEKEGYQAHPEQMGLLMPIYVGETDEEARREFEEHFWYFQRKLIPGILLSPPGYTSVQSALRIFKGVESSFISGVKTWDDVEAGSFATVGSPETVFEKLAGHLTDLGAGNLLTLMQLGNMPSDKARANMTRFAEQVMPRLAEAFPDAAEPVPQQVAFPDEHLAVA